HFWAGRKFLGRNLRFGEGSTTGLMSVERGESAELVVGMSYPPSTCSLMARFSPEHSATRTTSGMPPYDVASTRSEIAYRPEERSSSGRTVDALFFVETPLGAVLAGEIVV
ncbi:MAG: hypothetical protein ACI9KE_006661, partial [Polyangiales bacterium]